MPIDRSELDSLAELEDRVRIMERDILTRPVYYDVEAISRDTVTAAINQFATVEEVQEILFNFSRDLRELLITHFNEGNCEITDDEFYNIIYS